MFSLQPDSGIYGHVISMQDMQDARSANGVACHLRVGVLSGVLKGYSRVYMKFPLLV